MAHLTFYFLYVPLLQTYSCFPSLSVMSLHPLSSISLYPSQMDHFPSLSVMGLYPLSSMSLCLGQSSYFHLVCLGHSRGEQLGVNTCSSWKRSQHHPGKNETKPRKDKHRGLLLTVWKSRFIPKCHSYWLKNTGMRCARSSS